VVGNQPTVAGENRGAGQVLREIELPSGVHVAGSRPQATYWPLPGAAATITLTLCHASGAAAPRRVIVSQTGRPRVERDAPTSIPEPAACP
jgi:hypothetical protein